MPPTMARAWAFVVSIRIVYVRSRSRQTTASVV